MNPQLSSYNVYIHDARLEASRNGRRGTDLWRAPSKVSLEKITGVPAAGPAIAALLGLCLSAFPGIGRDAALDRLYRFVVVAAAAAALTADARELKVRRELVAAPIDGTEGRVQPVVDCSFQRHYENASVSDDDDGRNESKV